MKTTSTQRTKRIAIRKTSDGYRVTGDARKYRSHSSAFNAAWRVCRRSGTSLYAITPAGRRILLLDASAIRNC